MDVKLPNISGKALEVTTSQNFFKNE